ncbi:hypothetical protein CFBP6625_00970 [Agrobacterium tumefaciens]|nr:hypothetical protein CFBP6625_00970 [Agrobacterium tumefaciens]
MAATQIIPVGVGEFSSAEFSVAVGTATCICINDDEGPAVSPGAIVRIEYKDPAGKFFEYDFLQSSNSGGSRKTAALVNGPGIYRATRIGSVRCGVFMVT